jgi:hypothetical protein
MGSNTPEILISPRNSSRINATRDPVARMFEVERHLPPVGGFEIAQLEVNGNTALQAAGVEEQVAVAPVRPFYTW